MSQTRCVRNNRVRSARRTSRLSFLRGPLVLLSRQSLAAGRMRGRDGCQARARAPLVAGPRSRTRGSSFAAGGSATDDSSDADSRPGSGCGYAFAAGSSTTGDSSDADSRPGSGCGHGHWLFHAPCQPGRPRDARARSTRARTRDHRDAHRMAERCRWCEYATPGADDD